jgi:hypothetical protein
LARSGTALRRPVRRPRARQLRLPAAHRARSRDGSGGARDGVSDTPSYPWLPREAEPYAARWTGWLPTVTLWQRWTRTRDSVPRCSSVSGEVTRSAT